MKRSTSSSSSSTNNANKLSMEEIKNRGLLLAKNRNLLQLHKDLVGESMLREEEFWQFRQDLLRTQDLINKQKRPIPSTITPAGLKAVNDGQGDVKFVLTPTIIRGILEENEFVRRAYLEHVPERMDDKTFFTHYFKSKFAGSAAVKKDGNEDANFLNAYYNQYMAAKEAAAAQKRPNTADLLGVDSQDSSCRRYNIDYINADNPNDHEPKPILRESAALLRRLNSHSAAILETTSHFGDQCEDVLLEDLLKRPPPRTVPISIHHDDAGAGQNDHNMEASLDLPTLHSLHVDPKAWIAGFPKPAKEYLSLMAPHHPKSADENDYYNIENLDQRFTTFPADRLVSAQRNATEILRHFWAAISNSSTTSGEDRITRALRMARILEEQIKEGTLDKLRHLAAAVPTEQVLFDQLTRHLYGSIEYACQRASQISIVQPKRPKL